MFTMSKVGLDSCAKEDTCRRCQELRFDNIFASLGGKETHGKLHLVVDYQLQTDNPSLSIELMKQIMDSCFLCQGDQEGNPAGSSMEGLGHAILLIPKEEPMEAHNEEPTGSCWSDQEEKPILDECLMCGFHCLRSERLEQHWSHVALEHLETPGIFGCSQCHSVWDTTKPFREHLLTHRLGQEASLLDLRDLDACNIFQICFGVSEERLEEAGLGHLFQTPMEQTAPPPSEPLPPRRPAKTKNKPKPRATSAPEKELGKKTLDRCLVCGYEFMYLPAHRAQSRWTHLATCHLDNPHIFSCSVCHKGFHYRSNFKNHVKKSHPERNSPTSRKLILDKRTAEHWQLYQTCFGAIKAKFKKSCSLCGYQLPTCRYWSQISLQRWEHVSQMHADGRPLYFCHLCKKGGKQIGAVTYYCKRNHPRKKVEVDNQKEFSELHQRCFLIA